MTIRAFVAMAGAALRSLVAYQMSFLFGLLASAFSALAMFYLWHAVLANSGGSAGFAWPQMKAYLLITFVASSLVSAYTDYRMAGRIQRGDVAMDLVRPVDYQLARFAESCGFAVYEAGTTLVVAAIAAMAFGGIPTPAASAVPWFVLSALLVLPLRFSIVYASGLLTFWTQNYVGVQAARLAIVTLLSGSLVPLAFLPEWLRLTATFLPFAGMAATPALIYVGQLSGADAARAIVVQAGWGMALWLLARLFWQRASRQLTVNGG